MLPWHSPPPRLLLQPLPTAAAVGVIAALVATMLWIFASIHDAQYGWTKPIAFGSMFASRTLPELQAVPHYVDPGSPGGYDGQFYAQLALDPTLRNPALPAALDAPAYRARRIGLPALSFLLGVGRPAWIISVYSVLNVVFWVALAVVLFLLHRPWTAQSLLCLGASLFCFGVTESISGALTDVPAVTLMFASVLAAGSSPLLAAAVLVRETCFLAVLASLDFRRQPVWDSLRRNAVRLLVAALPVGLWLLYVHARLGGASAAGAKNFSPPFRALWHRLALAWQEASAVNVNVRSLPDLFYCNFVFHEFLAIVALLVQGLYLVLRPAPRLVVWRLGAIYLALGCVLGSAVWEGVGAAARTLLPMSIACNLLLATESRPRWFWCFFLLTASAVPFGVFQLAGLRP